MKISYWPCHQNHGLTFYSESPRSSTGKPRYENPNIYMWSTCNSIWGKEFYPCSVTTLAFDWLTTVKDRHLAHLWHHHFTQLFHYDFNNVNQFRLRMGYIFYTLFYTRSTTIPCLHSCVWINSYIHIGKQEVTNNIWSCYHDVRLYMGQVTAVRLSCYLVLLSNDSKTR